MSIGVRLVASCVVFLRPSKAFEALLSHNAVTVHARLPTNIFQLDDSLQSCCLSLHDSQQSPVLANRLPAPWPVSWTSQPLTGNKV